MSTTLYRKYRPQVFRDVIGQQHIKTTLLAELTSGAVAHAYLFVGPRGIGKTTMARLLAKAINCEHAKNGEPDNTCRSCESINTGRSLDLIEIDAASHTQVDHVREYILPAARTATAIGRYKTFIIDEVHMLSISAFNALLKMLEEPPAHVIFILATTEVHRIPTTIISRCQRFDFHRVNAEDTVQRMTRILDNEGIRVDRTVLERIARLSQGSLRDAESILGQVIALGDKHVTLELADVVLPRSDVLSAVALLDSIATVKIRAALELIQRLVDDGIQVGHFMNECIDLARILLLAKYNVESTEVLSYASDLKDFRLLANRMSNKLLQETIDVFMRRERDVRYTTLQQLPLELAVIELISNQENLHTVPKGKEPSIFSISEKGPVRNIDKTNGVNFSETEVSARWNRILEKVKVTNASLALLLINATPRAIIDGTLTIIVPYQLHSDRLTVKNQRLALEQVLSEFFKIAVTFFVRVDSGRINETHAAIPNGDVWQQALQAFSGNDGQAE